MSLDIGGSPQTVADLLDEVERIRPVIEECADTSEADRRLADRAYEAMLNAGLFGMLAPKAHGGLELPITDVLEVWEAVARIDSAAAWNLVMNQSIAAFAAWLPEEGAKELFAQPPVTVAGALFPPAAARRVDGGWLITGRVPFASGCHNAAWLAMPAVELDGDQPKIDPGTGQPAPFGAFFPRSDAEILDTWHTVGMRGTGSADISVTDLFVPDRRTMPVAPLSKPAPGFEGPLYWMMPFPPILGEATVSVGVAAAAVDDAIEVVSTKVPAYQATPLREQQLAQHGLGKALARVNAARDTLHAAANAATRRRPRRRPCLGRRRSACSSRCASLPSRAPKLSGWSTTSWARHRFGSDNASSGTSATPTSSLSTPRNRAPGTPQPADSSAVWRTTGSG